MKLIEKINYLFSKINWKDSFLDATAIRYMNEIKDSALMEPEPPTVRPMSELPEGNKRFLFKVEVEKSYIEYVSGRAIINKDTAYVSLDNYNSVIPLVKNPNRIRQLIGWLPLPNPNDIKI